MDWIQRDLFQIFAMMKKNLTLQFRQKKFCCCQIMLPFVLLLFVFLIDLLFAEISEQTKLDSEPIVFGDSDIPYDIESLQTLAKSENFTDIPYQVLYSTSSVSLDTDISGTDISPSDFKKLSSPDHQDDYIYELFEDFLDSSMSSTTTDRLVLGGITFQKTGNEDRKYTIQYEAQQAPEESVEKKGDLLFPYLATPSPFCEFIKEKLKTEMCESVFLISLMTYANRVVFNDSSIRTKVAQIPFDETKDEESSVYVQSDFLSFFVFFIYPLILLFPLPVYLYTLVMEKEKRILELLKLMGLRKRNYIVSNYLSFLMHYVFVNIVLFYVCGAMFQHRLMTQTNFILLMICFIGAGLSTISLAFCLSSFVGKIVHGTLLGCFVMMMTALLSTFSRFIMNEGVLYYKPILLISPLHVMDITSQFAYRCNKLDCPNFDDLIYGWENNLSLFISILLLYFNALLYFGLYLYFDQVIPKKVGRTKHPLFFLRPIFRICRFLCSGKEDDGIEEDDDDERSVKYEENEHIDQHVQELMENIENGNINEKNRMILVQAVVKKYGNHHALKNLFFEVKKSEAYGLLGMNGAGKSTIMRILTGFMKPSSVHGKKQNRIYVNGKSISNVQNLRKNVGFVPQFSILYDCLTAREHLNFLHLFQQCQMNEHGGSGLYGSIGSLIKKLWGTSDTVVELLKKVELYEPRPDWILKKNKKKKKKKKKCRCNSYFCFCCFCCKSVCQIVKRISSYFFRYEKLVGQMSGGMARRLAISLSFIGDPKIIILDEPTTGLDPHSRRKIWSLLIDAKNNLQKTLLISSHSMEEVESICDRVGMMNEGRLICHGNILDLKEKYASGYNCKIIKSSRSENFEFLDDLSYCEFSVVHEYDNLIRFELTPREGFKISRLFQDMEWAKQKGKIDDWEVNQSSMDSVFLNVLAKDQKRLFDLKKKMNKKDGFVEDEKEVKLEIEETQEEEEEEEEENSEEIIEENEEELKIEEEEEENSMSKSDSNSSSVHSPTEEESNEEEEEGLSRTTNSEFSSDNGTTEEEGSEEDQVFKMKNKNPILLYLVLYLMKIINCVTCISCCCCVTFTDQLTQFFVLTKKNICLYWNGGKSFCCLLCLLPFFMNLLSFCAYLFIISVYDNNFYLHPQTFSPVNGITEECVTWYDSKCYNFIYSTSDSVDAEILMNKIIYEKGISDSSYLRLKDSFHMKNYFINHPNTTFVGILFPDTFSFLNSNSSLEYVLYFNHTNKVDSLVPDVPNVLPFWKNLIDSSIIAVKNGQKPIKDYEVEVELKRYPKIPSNILTYLKGTLITDILPTMMMFLFSFYMIVFLYRLVQEKENLQFHNLQIMGMKRIPHFCSYYLLFTIFNLFISLHIVLAGTFVFQFQVMISCNFFIMFLLFLLFFQALLNYPFILWKYISSKRTSVLVGFFAGFLLIAFGIIAGGDFMTKMYSSEQSIFIPLLLHILLVPTNFSKSFWEIAYVTAPVFNRQENDFVIESDFGISNFFGVMEFRESDQGIGEIGYQIDNNIPFFITFIFLIWHIFLGLSIILVFQRISLSCCLPKSLCFNLIDRASELFDFGFKKVFRSNKNSNISSEEEEQRLLHQQNDLKEEKELAGQKNMFFRIQGLKKIFFSSGRFVRAVDGLNLGCRERVCLSVLGHNGAGKSTTLGVATGFHKPTKGNIYINNKKVGKENTRRLLGVCNQYDILYDDLTAKQHLVLFLGIKKRNRSPFRGIKSGFGIYHFFTQSGLGCIKNKEWEEEIERLLKSLSLYEVRNDKVKTFSGGMKRRLSVLISLIGDPQCILLDEPTTGMDPYSRQEVWELINYLKKEKMILLTSHSMEETAALSDKITIMKKGKLQCVGTALSLKAKYGNGYNLKIILEDESFEEVEKNKEVLKIKIREECDGRIVAENGGNLLFRVKFEQIDGLIRVLRWLEEDEDENDELRSSLNIRNFGVGQCTLEDVYLSITGHSEEKEESEESEEMEMENFVTEEEIEIEEEMRSSSVSSTDEDSQQEESNEEVTSSSSSSSVGEEIVVANESPIEGSTEEEEEGEEENVLIVEETKEEGGEEEEEDENVLINEETEEGEEEEEEEGENQEILEVEMDEVKEVVGEYKIEDENEEEIEEIVHEEEGVEEKTSEMEDLEEDFLEDLVVEEDVKETMTE